MGEGEQHLIEKAKGHLRTVKEQIARVERCIDEYAKRPDRERSEDLGLLANLETSSSLGPGTRTEHGQHSGRMAVRDEDLDKIN